MYRSLPFLLMITFPLGVMFSGCTHSGVVSRGSADQSRLPASIKAVLLSLPNETTQVIVVTAGNKGPVSATVYAAEKRGDAWISLFTPFDAIVGRNGFALPGEKREGDGKTPSGIFPLEEVFGYAPHVETKMAYRQARDNDIWIDDPESPDYNTWTKKGQTGAASFELMRRHDDLYKYGIITGYNRDPVVKGLGSAIFFHIRKGDGRPTSGCVGLAEDDLVKIIAWLDPSLRPLTVMGNLQREWR
ncbi:MAG: L,D-transpeptidase catalytic domain [Syntrophorhabdaceae bacterium PtaU1.Bin034]|nr:MAG: L,D-transpeptidase catalytic domain [Syntrophorhabdaceae bacterium PtaU1.Bin034]